MSERLNAKEIAAMFGFFLLAILMPISVYFLNSRTQDVRNRAATSFDSSSYRGLARFGAGSAPDIFNTMENAAEWADYKFGWYHNWRRWRGYSFENLVSGDMPEMAPIPPSVGFSGIISPGWAWAEPSIAGCTQEIKDDLADYIDGDIIWIGNEPGWGDQRDPHSYAQSYKSWYDCIKSVNPNIRVAPGAFIPTYKYGTKMKNWENAKDPLNTSSPRWDASDPSNIKPAGGITYIQYLTYTKESYESLYGSEMPVDAYVIHLYNLYEDAFNESQSAQDYADTIKDELIAFRTWMKNNGEERLSLTTKETGFLIVDPVLDPNDDEDKWEMLGDRMVAMLNMYNSLTDPSIGNPNDGNRLLQRWSWFVAGNPDPCEYEMQNACGSQDTSFVLCPGITGYFLAIDCDNPSTRITTPLGERYKSYISTVAASYDSTPPAKPTVSYTVSGTTASVTFTATDNGTVNDYEISLGSQAGEADVVNWQSTNTQKTYSLPNAVGKYVNVKAIDDGYNWSDVSSELISSCTPDCAGKECGPDGCGDTCGTCPSGETCNSSGQCVAACTPNCTGKECGSDGCGGSCGTCSSGETCNSSGICVTLSSGAAGSGATGSTSTSTGTTGTGTTSTGTTGSTGTTTDTTIGTGSAVGSTATGTADTGITAGTGTTTMPKTGIFDNGFGIMIGLLLLSTGGYLVFTTRNDRELPNVVIRRRD